MEAATLKTKKKIKKGKLKQTIKNILCRPDPNFWPQTSEHESKILIEILNSLKVNIPDFKKSHWNELSQIPKELRPKPPPIPKVEGLIFGISECQKSIECKECVGVLIEATVNPKTIVQPLIELCTDKSVAVLCLKQLRSVTKINFGIPTSVLGVKHNCLTELEKTIYELSKCHQLPNNKVVINNIDDICISGNSEKIQDIEIEPACPYLYRTDKKYRVFIPSVAEDTSVSNKFIGQNFITLPSTSRNEKTDSKKYMKMIVKKISSNPNRRQNTKH